MLFGDYNPTGVSHPLGRVPRFPPVPPCPPPSPWGRLARAKLVPVPSCKSYPERGGDSNCKYWYETKQTCGIDRMPCVVSYQCLQLQSQPAPVSPCLCLALSTGRLPLTFPNKENEVGFTPQQYAFSSDWTGHAISVRPAAMLGLL